MKTIKNIFIPLLILVLTNTALVSYASESEIEEEVKTLLKAGKKDEILKMGESAVEPLIKLLNTESSSDRFLVINLLGEINDPRAIEPIINVFGKGSLLINLSTINVVVKMGDPAREPLIKALNHKSPYVRNDASKALGRMKDPKTINRLIEVLKDDNVNMRIGAVNALGKIGDESAIEPIISMLKDEDELVVKKAVIALKEITKKDFGTDQEKWREWLKENKAK